MSRDSPEGHPAGEGSSLWYPNPDERWVTARRLLLDKFSVRLVLSYIPCFSVDFWSFAVGVPFCPYPFTHDSGRSVVSSIKGFIHVIPGETRVRRTESSGVKYGPTTSGVLPWVPSAGYFRRCTRLRRGSRGRGREDVEVAQFRESRKFCVESTRG